MALIFANGLTMSRNYTLLARLLWDCPVSSLLALLYILLLDVTQFILESPFLVHIIKAPFIMHILKIGFEVKLEPQGHTVHVLYLCWRCLDGFVQVVLRFNLGLCFICLSLTSWSLARFPLLKLNSVGGIILLYT